MIRNIIYFGFWKLIALFLFLFSDRFQEQQSQIDISKVDVVAPNTIVPVAIEVKKQTKTIDWLIDLFVLFLENE